MAEEYIRGATYRLITGNHYRPPGDKGRRYRERVQAGQEFQPTEAEFRQNQDRLRLVVDRRSLATAPKASPAARKLADDEGVDLSELTGTGKGGAITLTDVKAAVEEQEQEPSDGDGSEDDDEGEE